MPFRQKHLRGGLATLFVVILAIQSFSTVQAQPYGYVQANCPNIVKQAIDTVSAECSKTGRGKLCYGNSTITAQYQPGVSNVQFSAPGDTVDVSALKPFTLSGMNTTANTWGVAEMKIKADLPDADPSVAVTMILFGNVQLSDGSNDANAAVLTQTPGAIAKQNQLATVTSNAINQQATHVAASVTKIAGLEGTATAHALTSTPTGTIPAIKMTQAAATATKLAADVNTATAAPIPQTSIPGAVNGPYKGLQAFYFQSSDTAPCDQAPHDGILIQSPQGKQRITLSIDGATISLGSTVYITAQPSKFLTIYTLEGSAIVTAAGQTQVAGAGTYLQVPLDVSLRASGAPLASNFYGADAIRALPTRVLPNTSVSFVEGLPANVVLADWTAVFTTVSGKCPDVKIGNISTRVVKLAYDDTTMWYANWLVLKKSSQGVYMWTINLPAVPPNPPSVATWSLSVISPTHISGNLTQTNLTDGSICSMDTLDLTQNAASTATLSPSATP